MRFFAIALLSATATPSIAGDVWPQFGGPTGDFHVADTAPGKSGMANWKRALGPGTSGIVADGTLLYTMCMVPKEGGKAGDEVTLALDPATGKTLWEQSVAVKMLPKQESFRSAPMQPQATPAVYAGIVYTIGFTGLLFARDAASGKVTWSTDLVKDHGATPVQFGFAASPMIFDGRLIVHVGGKYAVVAFDPKDGKVLWRSAAAEPSYATPVVMQLNDRPTLVQLTRDSLLGLDLASGSTLWIYTLPEQGLTNVPTPIALSGGRLLVAGQGLGGTRLLQITGSGKSFEVKEIWHQPKIQFFYSNWVTDGQNVYGFSGNTGKRFATLRVDDGSIVARDSNLTDANVLCLGNKLLVCRGDGLLSIGSVGANGYVATLRGQPVSGHCWAAPTVLGDTVIVRSETELAALKLAQLGSEFKAPADKGVTALEEVFGKPKAKPPE